jgi:hypothetical protein
MFQTVLSYQKSASGLELSHYDCAEAVEMALHIRVLTPQSRGVGVREEFVQGCSGRRSWRIVLGVTTPWLL